MRKWIVLFILIAFNNNVFAGDMRSAFNQTLAEADSLKQDSYSHIQHFNPNDVFKNYTPNPSETNYYGDVTDKSANKLDQDKLNVVSSTDVGKIVSTSVKDHPKFVISDNDPNINHSQFIQNEADAIVRGVTDHYVDCKATQTCQTTFEKQLCEEAPQVLSQSCKKTLNIDLNPQETTTHHTLLLHLKTRDHNYAAVSINAVTGVVNSIGPHDASVVMEGRLPSTISNQDLAGAVTEFNTNNRGTHLDRINFPTRSNGMILDFGLSGSKKFINLDMKIDLVSKVVTYNVKDRWTDTCSGLLNQSSCSFKAESCTSPQATKIIHGIPVTRDCWEESFQYQCHGGSGAGNCTPLQTQGCEQISSACKNKTETECTLYQQTYQCPIKTCANTSNIACGDGQTYCLDGDCVDHSYKPSGDFASSISALSAVSDASKQFDPSTQTLFAGHSSECSEIPVGFSNCCAESGWGQDSGLAHCSPQAKKLHEEREKGMVIKVGRYCSGPDSFPCSEHSQVFCVFNSKLAKIIQDQGRHGQLHIDFGSAKNANCLGITADQFKSIDLGKVDFTDFYADIKAKQPDMKQVRQTIDQHIQQFQNAGQVNG